MCVCGCCAFLHVSVFVHASAKQVSECYTGAGLGHVEESCASLVFNVQSSESHYFNFFFLLNKETVRVRFGWAERRVQTIAH